MRKRVENRPVSRLRFGGAGTRKLICDTCRGPLQRADLAPLPLELLVRTRRGPPFSLSHVSYRCEKLSSRSDGLKWTLMKEISVWRRTNDTYCNNARSLDMFLKHQEMILWSKKTFGSKYDMQPKTIYCTTPIVLCPALPVKHQSPVKEHTKNWLLNNSPRDN